MATIVFVLIAVVDISEEETGNKSSISSTSFLSPHVNKDLVGAPLFTVLLSVFAHGLSATPLVTALSRALLEKKRIGTTEQVQAQEAWDTKDTHVRARRGYSARSQRHTSAPAGAYTDNPSHPLPPLQYSYQQVQQHHHADPMSLNSTSVALAPVIPVPVSGTTFVSADKSGVDNKRKEESRQSAKEVEMNVTVGTTTEWHATEAAQNDLEFMSLKFGADVLSGEV